MQTAPPPARRIYVWDIAVRTIHMAVALLFLANAAFTDEDGALHAWIGFILLGLVILRVLWGLIGTRHARFSDFPPDPAAALDQARDMALGRRRAHIGHSPLGALMIYNLYATLIGIGITGWMLTSITFFGMDWVEEMHEALVGWAEVSALAHIAAVVIESRRLGINLPGAMVSGYKTLPADLPLQEDPHPK